MEEEIRKTIADNIAAVRDAGASGACIMSGLMTCGDPAAYVEELRDALR